MATAKDPYAYIETAIDGLGAAISESLTSDWPFSDTNVTARGVNLTDGLFAIAQKLADIGYSLDRLADVIESSKKDSEKE